MMLGIALVSILVAAPPDKTFSCTQANNSCTVYSGAPKELADTCVQHGGKLGKSCPSEKVLATCTAKVATWDEVQSRYSVGDKETDSDAIGVIKLTCEKKKGTFKVTPAFAKLGVPAP